MTKVIKENIQEIFNYKERIFIVLIMSIIISAGAYAFLIEKAIMNVVAREDVIKESHVLSASVAGLEERYFSIKNNISLDLAYAKGFKDSEVSFFISSQLLSTLVSRNEL